MNSVTHKICPDCGELKSLDDYHKDRTRKLGVTARCKLCRCITGSSYYRNNTDACKERHKKWRKTEQGIQNSVNRNKRYIEKYPERFAAGQFVKHAIKHGVIPPVNSLNCANCKDEAVHYHHDKGYDPPNWLDVVPLCMTCHRTEHQDK